MPQMFVKLLFQFTAMLVYLLLFGLLLPDNPPAFQEQVIDANISIGYGLALGDVDGDKKPDIYWQIKNRSCGTGMATGRNL